MLFLMSGIIILSLLWDFLKICFSPFAMKNYWYSTKHKCGYFQKSVLYCKFCWTLWFKVPKLDLPLLNLFSFSFVTAYAVMPYWTSVYEKLYIIAKWVRFLCWYVLKFQRCSCRTTFWCQAACSLPSVSVVAELLGTQRNRTAQFYSIRAWAAADFVIFKGSWNQCPVAMAGLAGGDCIAVIQNNPRPSQVGEQTCSSALSTELVTAWTRPSQGLYQLPGLHRSWWVVGKQAHLMWGHSESFCLVCGCSF